MSPEIWNRIAEIAGEALEQPQEQREAYARKQCGDNAELLAGVLDMLRANEEMGDFLDAPHAEGDTVSPLLVENFGPYRAVREIGHGGMSLVYLGERVEKDFSQRVAIKVILHKAPGVLQESETRILARLEHPNIARFLDAGVTKAGLPYLVMEYVDGVSCTDFARKIPDERSKLRLFLQICAGVQYANRSLIVHRDLKPGNVLVDQSGAVKLLDFGIAKILTPDPSQTATMGTRAYTPDYASPEQILGNPVTTATDVYSLGVLLCEIVAGQRPRAMLELPMPELVKLAQTEISEVPFTGDLEVIARKALRCDPSERYESAADLARDVERYLEGKPIEARPATLRYRTIRFVQRNRYAVAAGLLTAAVTLTAGGVALWQARLASQRFEQVRSLAGSVLFEVYDVIEPLPGSLKAQQLIVKRSVDYLDSLARDATANAELQVEAAKGFTRLGSIEGTNKLGNAKVALGYHDRALDLIRKAVAKYPKDLSVRRQYFLTLDFAGAAYEGQAQYDTAISLAEEAKRTAAETLQMFPKDADARRDLPRSQYGLAFNFARSKAHAAKALPELEAATSGWKKILDESPDDVTAMEEMAACERMMGARYFERRDYEGSRRHYSAAYEWNQKLAARDPSKLERVAFDLGQVAVTWNAVGERDKGLPMLQKQLDLRRKIMESDVANMDALRRYGVSLNRICDTYVKMKDAPKAIEFGQQAVAVQRRVYAKDPGSLLVNREYLYALVDLAHAYAIGKQKDKYCPLIREAEPLLHGPLDKTAETFADRDRKADVRMTALSCPK